MRGPVDGAENRVNRGGAFNNSARNARSAYRNNWNPGNRNNDLGFRPAKAPHLPIAAVTPASSNWTAAQRP